MTATSPLPVTKALKKLGADIKDARIRRRISVEIMSARASLSRTTLNRIEKGEQSVSIGAYASVLYVLRMINRLSDLVDFRTDQLGMELEREQLPKRIRKSTK